MEGLLSSRASREAYREPEWRQGQWHGKTPPEQMRESLTRSRRGNKPFALAYSQALENIRWPHDTDSRREWVALFHLEAHIMAWSRAYHRESSGVDMAMLHYAIEDGDLEFVLDARQDPFVDTRRCSGPCGQIKPADQFGRRADQPDGISKQCKECVNAALNAYRSTKPDDVRRWAREWARRNREQVAAAQRSWSERHRSERAEYQRKRNQDPEIRARRRELARARREKDPEKDRAKNKAYRERNREQIRQRARERYRQKLANPILSLGERLHAKTIVSPDGCWLWTGAKLHGYGRIQDQRKQRAAHRVAWEIGHGPIPPKHDIVHTCDRRDCVRLSHLELVTMAERRRRDRQRAASKSSVDPGDNGEKMT